MYDGSVYSYKCRKDSINILSKYDKEYTIEKGNMRFEGSILDKKKSYKIVTENKKIVSATKNVVKT